MDSHRRLLVRFYSATMQERPTRNVFNIASYRTRVVIFIQLHMDGTHDTQLNPSGPFKRSRAQAHAPDTQVQRTGEHHPPLFSRISPRQWRVKHVWTIPVIRLNAFIAASRGLTWLRSIPGLETIVLHLFKDKTSGHCPNRPNKKRRCYRKSSNRLELFHRVNPIHPFKEFHHLVTKTNVITRLATKHFDSFGFDVVGTAHRARAASQVDGRLWGVWY